MCIFSTLKPIPIKAFRFTFYLNLNPLIFLIQKLFTTTRKKDAQLEALFYKLFCVYGF